MALIDKETALADMDYYISAKKLIEDILEARGIEIETVPKLIRLIKAQPKVGKDINVPIKCGRWLEKKDFIYCSECGDGFDAIYKIDYRFCPNCGARMESE